MFRFPMLLEVLVVTERVEAFRALDLNEEEERVQREAKMRKGSDERTLKASALDFN